MNHRTNFLATLLTCFSFVLLNTGIINTAYAEQQTDPNKIYGKVTDIIDVAGYTYAEVDTGKKKVWAAGPTTPLKIGDMIAFSTGMPMEDFHSKSMNRNFSMLYFIGGFITDKETQTTNTPATQTTVVTSPHSKTKQQQASNPVKDIHKAEGGNTIAEIYTHKLDLKGKSVRVRGQVTKFTPAIMGKNWIHIRDSSTKDDLTVTTDSTVAIGDVIIIEGKLELDKDYGYGYVYPVILVDAGITKE